MSLLPCKTWIGGIDVRSGEPGVTRREHAVYVPVNAGAYDPDPRWGLYDQDGSLISEAAYRRTTSNLLVGQQETVSAEDRYPTAVIEDECVYLGQLHNHYGHFLVSSLARVWHILERPTRKVIFHSCMKPSELFALDFVRQTFDALDIHESDIIVPTESTLIKSIIVPAPSFQELAYAYPIHAGVCRYISNKICGRSSLRSADRIFLSKKNLGSGVWRFVNEGDFAAAIERRGIRIVCPESMTFVEQLEMFRSYSSINGIAGSALHTSLFSETPHKLVGLAFEEPLQSNFGLVDEIMNNSSHYYHPTALTKLEPLPGFHLSFNIDDVEGVAEEFIEKIEA